MTYIWNQKEQTKEVIFDLCAKVGLSERRFLEAVKSMGLGAFCVDNWHKYMVMLTAMSSYSPCSICGAPKGWKRGTIGQFGNTDGAKCLLHPEHTSIPGLTRVAKLWNQDKTEEQLTGMILGEKCKHGFYLSECHPCYVVACANVIDINAPLPLLMEMPIGITSYNFISS